MILCNMAAPARGSVDVAAGPSRIKLFARREGLPNWAEVTVASNESVAAAKKAIIAELGIDAKPDAITLMKEGAAVPLDDRRLVEGQLEAGDSIIVITLTARAGIHAAGGGAFSSGEFLLRAPWRSPWFRRGVVFLMHL